MRSLASCSVCQQAFCRQPFKEELSFIYTTTHQVGSRTRYFDVRGNLQPLSGTTRSICKCNRSSDKGRCRCTTNMSKTERFPRHQQPFPYKVPILSIGFRPDPFVITIQHLTKDSNRIRLAAGQMFAEVAFHRRDRFLVTVSHAGRKRYTSSGMRAITSYVCGNLMRVCWSFAASLFLSLS
jgi:hypothetical protein